MAFHKKGPISVPKPPENPFRGVWGSRPEALRQPRIKPMQGQTNYAKTEPQNSPLSVGGGSFAGMGQPRES